MRDRASQAAGRRHDEDIGVGAPLPRVGDLIPVRRVAPAHEVSARDFHRSASLAIDNEQPTRLLVDGAVGEEVPAIGAHAL